MQTATRLMAQGQVNMEYAEVVQWQDDRLLVKMSSGLCLASRATGCLVAPEPGDRVLVSDDGAGEAYILSVLVRVAESPAHVGVSGPMVLGDAENDLDVCGESVHMVAVENLDIASARLNMAAHTTTVRADIVDAAGSQAVVAFSSLKSVFSSLQQTAGRVLSRFKRVYTRIDEFEDERVARKRLVVASNFDISSDRTVIHADKNVDVKAAKINLG